MTLSPIALFVYKRPEHTRRCLESLQRNKEFSNSPVYIFSDGAKNSTDAREVTAVREVIRELRHDNKTLIERDENWGLAKSIIAGVTDLCDRYGRVIVVEDDLIVSRTFLQFMNETLERYSDEPRVMHISGYMFPIADPQALPETFFYRATSCWGWATWARAWRAFCQNPVKLLDAIDTEEAKYSFNIDGSYDFYGSLVKQKLGSLDSWAIRWYASVFLKRGLCLHPARSLVANRGHDGTGVHCGYNSAFDVSIADECPSRFPDSIEESRDALRQILNFNRELHKPRFGKRLKNRLLRYAKRLM